MLSGFFNFFAKKPIPKILRSDVNQRLEVLATVLKENTKYIIPEGTDLVTVLGDEKDKIVPLPKGEKK